MSKYQELLQNPPTFTKLYDSENLREVIFETISCMCDNKHFLKFRKNSDGDFRMNGNGHALRNWSMKHEDHVIEWEADDNNWGSVVNMINTGTSKISTVKLR
tara:strand:+ start:969 stop:1274 length:306 start_codon:yes stop_codon:yes gene_type:complete